MRASTSVPASGARLFAWSGAVLFALSLSFFLYSYLVTFAETTVGGGSPRVAAAFDVVLFSAFALHHSVFARERVRAAITRVAGPLERSVYVWIASLLFIAVCVLWRPVPGQLWQVTGVAAWLLYGVQAIGVWLTLRAATAIDVWDLAGVRFRGPDKVRPTLADGPDNVRHTVEFKTTGPYGWVRHPIYSAWFLIVFGIPTMTGTRLVFAVTSSVYLLLAIPYEEMSLLATTDGAYGRYMRQVKWKLVPWVY